MASASYVRTFEDMIQQSSIVYFSKPGCTLCVKLDQYLIDNQEKDFTKINLYDLEDDEGLEILDHMKKKYHVTTFPICFIDSEFVGTFENVVEHVNKKNMFSTNIDDL